MYTVKEISQEIKVTERTVRRWIESRILPSHKIGGVVRIDERDLEAFIHKHNHINKT